MNLKGDSTAIAKHTGISERIVRMAKKHFFELPHEVQTGPHGQKSFGLFTPNLEYAKWWNAGITGSFRETQREDLKMLIQHEYIEAKLMEAGLPYKSSFDGNFEGKQGNWTYTATPGNFGADDLAPSFAPDPFSNYRNRLGLSIDDLHIKDDLSNLDDVVRRILKKIKK